MSDKKIVVKLDSSELATVLAALRHWQAWQQTFEDRNVPFYPSHEGFGGHFMDHAPLSQVQIDELCERINCSPELEPPIVYITVKRGIADIGHIPKGIEVEIVDYDSLRVGGQKEFETYPEESQQWIIDQNRNNLQFLEHTCGVLAFDPRLQKK